MTLGRFSLMATVLLSFCAAASAGPVTQILDTNSYNFALSDGGGGAQATINKGLSVEIFCVDFANDIYVPVQGYTAYLTPITQAGLNTGDTRFGLVGSGDFSQISLGGDTTDAGTINTASNLGRYQMAAFLVSQYNLSNNTAQIQQQNNGIQQAIWDILDPGTFPLFTTATTTSEIEAAAQWYTSMGGNAGSTTLTNFLANYRIVSSSVMTPCTSGPGAGTGLLCGGFQEQITAVPEPRYLALMLVGLLLVGSVVVRKFRTAQRAGA